MAENVFEAVKQSVSTRDAAAFYGIEMCIRDSHGIEYGSARWGSAADIAPYMDKDFFHNIPMTQTEPVSYTHLRQAES